MALTKTEISELYVTIFNRVSERKGNDFWQTYNTATPEVETKEQVANVMLGSAAAEEYFGVDPSDPDQLSNQKFIETIYLNTLNKTKLQDEDGINYWVSQLEAGQSRGLVIDRLIAAVNNQTDSEGNPKPITDAQQQFYNRVAASDYAYDVLFTAPDDRGYLRFDQGLTVTHESYTLDDAKEDIDHIPVIFDLTEAVDDLTGAYVPPTGSPVAETGHLGDDILNGSLFAPIGEGPTTGTLNPDDAFDGNDGIDTLALTTDIASQSFVGVMDGIDVERLQLISPDGAAWTDITFDRDFDEVVLEMGQQEYNLTLASLDAATEVTITDLKGDGNNHAFAFEPSTASNASTHIELEGDMDEAGNITHGSAAIKLNTQALFTAATTIDNYISLKNFDVIGTGFSGMSVYRHTLLTEDGGEMLTANAINSVLNLENVKAEADFQAQLLLQHDQAFIQAVVNMTDTDNASAWLLDNSLFTPPTFSSTSRDDDFVTLNAAGVQNTGNGLFGSGFSAPFAETVNVNITASELSPDSAFNRMATGEASNSGTLATVNLNIEEGASLFVYSWLLRNTAGETNFNITGAGDVNIASLTVGGFADSVIIDGSTATGDVSLGFTVGLEGETSGVISDQVIFVNTGSGKDEVVFFATVPNDGSGGNARIQTNGGGDIIDVNTGVNTIVYELTTDSQAIFDHVPAAVAGFYTEVSGMDVIKNFNGLDGSGSSAPDKIELGLSLHLSFGGAGAFTAVTQKEDLIRDSGDGFEASDLEYYIGREGVDFFGDMGGDHATGFAHNGTDGYLFVDTNSDGDFVATEDMIIQLAGVTQFQVGDIDFLNN